jgi:hypothetical protein
MLNLFVDLSDDCTRVMGLDVAQPPMYEANVN